MHGINEFAYHFRGQDNFVQKNHAHNEIEIIHVVKGTGHMLKNGVLYEMRDIMLFFIDARIPHSVNPKETEHYVLNKIVIAADAFFSICDTLGVRKEAEACLLAPPVYLMHPDSTEQCDAIFARCLDCFQTNERKGLIWGSILEMLTMYDDYPKKKSTHNGIVETIIECVNELAFDNFSLERLCRKINVSKYYACHIFKKYVGMTIYEYVLSKKIAESKLLLTETDEPIYAIADKMGFNTSSAYVRFFKKEVGITPLQFRNNH